MELVQEQISVHGEPESADYSTEMAAHFGQDDAELESASSTPYGSAPSSPGRGRGYFFSAPASPVHFVLFSAPSSAAPVPAESPRHEGSPPSEFAFDFSSPLPISASVGTESMTSAEELFLNGQIRPMKLSSHLPRPQALAPLIDHEDVEEPEEGNVENRGMETKPSDITIQRGRDLKLRNGSVHRKSRSLSPLRDAAFEWNEDGECTGTREISECIRKLKEEYDETKQNESAPSLETTPSCSASSSRSSSSGRNSKKWIFLKDLLHRSKSEGRGNGKDKFWTSISSFSPSKEKKLRSEDNNKAGNETQKQKQYRELKTPSSNAVKPTNGVAKRRGPAPSAHELHYTVNRAQAEEMKKRTNLPYRHGLFGWLGFSSKGHSALNGLARSLNPAASSR